MTVNKEPDAGSPNPPAANPTGSTASGGKATANPIGSTSSSSNPTGSYVPTTGTIAAIPFLKQQKPKFGDLCEVGTGLWAAWTGGKPNGSWTGLEEPMLSTSNHDCTIFVCNIVTR